MFAWDRRPANKGAEKIVRQQCLATKIVVSHVRSTDTNSRETRAEGKKSCVEGEIDASKTSHIAIFPSRHSTCCFWIYMGMLLSPGLNMGMLGVC